MGAFESNMLKRGRRPSGAEKLVAVVADAASEEVINRFVVDQGIATSHVSRGSLDDAVATMATMKESPRYLIVDVSGVAMPISDLARLSEVVDPSVCVVAIGERNDVGLFRSLLQIGVQDYLVKPLTVDLLRRAIATTDQGTSSRMGKALSFVGTRGGVGVTTIATALARHLAEQTRRRIAYIDLDPYGGAATSMLGVAANNGLMEMLQNPQRLDQQLINQAFVAHSDRLFVLASELSFNDDVVFRPGALAELIAMLARHFHYILLDLPARAGALADETFNASSMIQIVADHSVYSAHEAARLSRFAEGRDSDPSVMVLLNAAHEPVPGRVKEEDFTTALARGSIQSFPYEPQTLAFAENLGEGGPGQRSAFNSAIVSLAHAITGTDARVAAPQPWYKRLLQKREAR